MRLTHEQQTIVNHNHGAARVFAVAGAGKTTAMVHRIHRLVQEGIFHPNRILASSFSKGTVKDLRTALSQWRACDGVKTQTLHSLGYRVIQQAQQRGYLTIPKSAPAFFEVDQQLFGQAVREARQQQVDFKDELDDIDQEDFLSYVGNCKGKLHYANLNQVEFPEQSPHRAIAKQAVSPVEPYLTWYLDLYRIFEELRRQQGWISFDDMLMTGWELLVKHPDLLQDMQRQFDCVIVDEFQDVNRAQFAILDLLTRPHHNYMVIGDDDQTIYEWRGAEVRFILKEFDRYKPSSYTITDNFRCTASQVALANAVIRHNRNRYIKQLNLTRGFHGCTEIHHEVGFEALGRSVVNQIKVALAAGLSPADIAILVRVYAQTPYIEQYLIKSGIPYGGADLVPFYRRTEVLKFLAFGELLHLETKVATDQLLTADVLQTWKTAWDRIKLVPPIRYLHKDLKDAIQARVLSRKASLGQAILAIQPSVGNDRMARQLDAFAQWLQTAAQKPSAKDALEQLDSCLGYRDYLKRHSGFKETGQGKVVSIEAIINYAADKGTLLEFLSHLDDLHAAEHYSREPEQCIRLTTIHQSKGLEWSMVIVPHCNQGTIPFGEDISDPELEEERRLLYVAITRSKQELHLYTLKDQPISQFLEEAKVTQILKKIKQLHLYFESDSAQWQAKDVVEFLKLIRTLGLNRYIEQWWTVELSQKHAIATTIQHFLTAAQHHQLLRSLGLDEQHIVLWQKIVDIEQQAFQHFPGLDDLLKPQPTVSRFQIFKLNEKVSHKKFGKGVVVAIKEKVKNSEHVVSVNFEQWGVKRILVTERTCTLHSLSRKTPVSKN